MAVLEAGTKRTFWLSSRRPNDGLALQDRLRRQGLKAAGRGWAQPNWSCRFSLVAADPVVQEASAGDPAAAAKRLAVLHEVALLDLSDAALGLARRLIAGGGLPQSAGLDATHIAIATVHGIDYLLTWNCRHIANAATRPRIEALCREAGYQPATICTPDQLLGEEDPA